MNFIGLFAQKAPNRVFLAIVLGALSGVAYAMIIPLVISVLTPETGQFSKQQSEFGTLFSWQISHLRHALIFIGLCVFILFAKTLSQIILTRISLDITTDLRRKIYHRIANAPLQSIEKVGHSKLIATITSDVRLIVAGARLITDVLTTLVTLCGMLFYLYYLNSDVFKFVIISIIFGVITYQVPMLIGRHFLVKARAYLDDLHESIKGLVYGSKELKLSPKKCENYFQLSLDPDEYNVRDASKTGQTIMRAAVNYGDLISLLVIGAVSFIFVNHYAISNHELIAVVMVLLYISGPVSTLLNFAPQFASAKIALNKVESLFNVIPQEPYQDAPAKRDWQCLTLKDVTFEYAQQTKKNDRQFSVGPLNLTINRGEITFIIGGNGSGKSTMAKLLSLHYPASSGQFIFDDEAVDDTNLIGFRKSISAIYTDYYLFDRLLSCDSQISEEKVNSLLRAFKLDKKVTYSDGQFSTLSLSDGQRKRMALIAALIEDTQLYLFDEWAADQDPEFKHEFYVNILPELKHQGKAVIVISHDDRYFNEADKLVVIENGNISNIEQANAQKNYLYDSQKKVLTENLV
ncbi:cyclic peptide export ABC transporter [Pseudoalteromonas sp. SMS1]|uniref:cyclic peptide export ABC transporter n=1 Tax=Pseudoalteromonas sp. SMS1 TaxID=2908894 RepID=UPI001F22C78D|nr:cyclic peptide export ABC transporter [Pseudoalteromonas sp. SMS1]MCF2859833.1 cyclic peptide export ABC transporter [Pseudoalteromonas sp. SMS1]